MVAHEGYFLTVSFVMFPALIVAVRGHRPAKELEPSLKEDKKPETTVVKLTDAAAYPEAVVVKFTHASVTLLAVFSPEGHLHFADVALPALR